METESDIKALFDEANALFEARSYQEALERYAAFFDNFSDYFTIYPGIYTYIEKVNFRERMGDCNFHLGNYYDAGKEYARVGSSYAEAHCGNLDDTRDDKMACFKRGCALAGANLLCARDDVEIIERVIKYYDRVIDLDPSFAAAYVGRAKAIIDMYVLYSASVERQKKAIKDFTKAIKLDPSHAETYYMRAEANQTLDLYEKVLEDCNRAIKLNPAYKDAYVLRGKTYHSHLGDSQQAIIDYTRVIKLDPENGEHYVTRGKVYAELNRNQQAINDYTVAIEIYRKSVEQNDVCGFNVRFERDLYAFEVYKLRGMMFFALESYHQAMNDYSEAIKIDLSDRLIYFLRSMCYEKLGNYSKAAADHNKGSEKEESIWLLSSRYDNADKLTDIGVDYDEKENKKTAIDYYSKAIDIDPEKALPYLGRGNVYWNMGQNIEAIEDYKIAARLGNEKAQEYLTLEGVEW